MVAVGATISAFWIIVANSWQQTPAGYVLRNGRAELTDFWAAVFNPSTLLRFPHTFVACLLAGALLVMGISAWLLLAGKAAETARKTLKTALLLAFVASLLTLYPFGHHHAMQVARTQPEKLAAMEGLIKGKRQAGWVVFGIPGREPDQMHFVIGIPGLLSWMVAGDANAYIPGLDDFRNEGQPTPPLRMTFLSFHSMVGLGMLFIGVTGLGVFLLFRKRLYDAKWYLRLLPWCIPLPLLACQLGWVTAEVGRQPWVVYRLLRTQDAFSTNVTGTEVLFSILMFGFIYLLLGTLYVFLLVRQVRHGPEPVPSREGTK
jgi:cytochrome d ubiquinol oxidase subunit I